jgi:hypothetical protein
MLPLPISSRTLYVARLYHLSVYIFINTFALGFFTCMLGCLRYHLLFGMLFVFTLMLSVMLVIFIINTVLMLIIKFTRGDLILDIISYIPLILFNVFIFFVLLADRFNLREMIIPVVGLIPFLLPPLWLAGIFEVVLCQNYTSSLLVISGLALLVPVLCLFILLCFLAPSFNKRLLQMQEEKKSFKPDKISKKFSWGKWLSQILTNSPAEKSFFEVFWIMLFREKNFKIMAYSFIGPLAFVWAIPIRQGKSFSESLAMLPAFYGVVLGLLSFFMFMLILYFSYSEHYQAAWIFQAIPLRIPGEALLGALKTMLIKIILPVLVSLSVFVLAVYGMHMLDDVVYTFGNYIILFIHLSFIYIRTFPFSKKPEVIDLYGRIFKTLLAFFIFAVLQIFHRYVLLHIPGSTLFMIVLMFMIQRCMFRKFREQKWGSLG